mmetsp:Transcript_57163/g.152470  ORF Transcript_57163/g.152470 Transcript_57163/m.152470 type:complete len:209 (-) Transcript_57163:254-880(-)
MGKGRCTTPSSTRKAVSRANLGRSTTVSRLVAGKCPSLSPLHEGHTGAPSPSRASRARAHIDRANHEATSSEFGTPTLNPRAWHIRSSRSMTRSQTFSRCSLPAPPSMFNTTSLTAHSVSASIDTCFSVVRMDAAASSCTSLTLLDDPGGAAAEMRSNRDTAARNHSSRSVSLSKARARDASTRARCCPELAQRLCRATPSIPAESAR